MNMVPLLSQKECLQDLMTTVIGTAPHLSCKVAEVCCTAGAKNKYLAYWSPLVATVALVTTGAEFTGPSMNPAFVSPSALMLKQPMYNLPRYQP